MAKSQINFGELGGGGVDIDAFYFPTVTASASSYYGNYGPSNAFSMSGAWYPNGTGFQVGAWIKGTFVASRKVYGVYASIASSGSAPSDAIWEVLDANDNVITELFIPGNPSTDERNYKRGVMFDTPIETTAIKLRAKSCSSSSGVTYTGFGFIAIIASAV